MSQALVVNLNVATEKKSLFTIPVIRTQLFILEVLTIVIKHFIFCITCVFKLLLKIIGQQPSHLLAFHS